MTETRAESAATHATTVNNADNELPEAFAKAETQLDALLDAFRTCDMEDAVKKTLLTPEKGNARPIDSWSLSDGMLCYLGGDQGRSRLQAVAGGRVARRGGCGGDLDPGAEVGDDR
jgi:hypothetical protein